CPPLGFYAKFYLHLPCVYVIFTKSLRQTKANPLYSRQIRSQIRYAAFFIRKSDGATLSKLFTLAFLLTLSNLIAQTFPARFQDGYILVSGRLDGQSIYILLDSGAPGLVLNREHFGDGSQPATCTGINGSFPCATRTVEDFEWLGIHHRRTEAILSDLSFLERMLGIRVDSLGGLSLLNGTGLSIDYDAQLLTIAADAPAAK